MLCVCRVDPVHKSVSVSARKHTHTHTYTHTHPKKKARRMPSRKTRSSSKKSRKVAFSTEVQVFDAPPAARKARRAPVAASAHKLPYARRALQVDRKWITERSMINQARSEHAAATALACSQRDSAEAVMSLLWKAKGTREWHDTGILAVAEDAHAENKRASQDVDELLALLAKPTTKYGNLTVEQVEAVLFS